MKSLPLYQNILGQAESLRGVTDHHFTAGRKALMEAAAVLRDAPRVILSGMGSSLFACTPLGYYLGAQVIEASELLYYRQHLCVPGAAVVLVSRSGDTIEVARLLPLLKERGVTVVGVTNELESLLAREADYAIEVHSQRDQLVAIQTYTGTVAALLLLGAAVRSELDGSWRKDLDQLADSLAIEKWIEETAEWRAFLERAPVIYLLGRGPSLGSTLEGALLFHETARFPAVSMSVAHFRHGPVEVVKPDFRALIFASQPATADLDSALARDLLQLGAEARIIAPGVPPILAPIAEIIPVQIAALRLACWRGVPAGQFRFAPAVTLTETGFGS